MSYHWKYTGLAQRNCNINLKLNHEILIVLRNLKTYDFHLIMQELGKLFIKINVISNGLEKYISYGINNKLLFIDSLSSN